MKRLVLAETHRDTDAALVGAYLVRELGPAAALCLARPVRPSAEDAAANAGAPRAPFEISADPVILLEEGTPTRTYWDAGADPVLLVRTRDATLAEAMTEASRTLGDAPAWVAINGGRVLTEGDVAPDITLLVTSAGMASLDDSGRARLAEADAIVAVKRRAGTVELPFLETDDEADNLAEHLPVFTFTRETSVFDSDDRDALVEWTRQRLEIGAERERGQTKTPVGVTH